MKRMMIESVSVLAALMSQLYNIRISVTGEHAYTNYVPGQPLSIVLPAIEMDDPNYMTLLRGYIDHEVGHVRFTDHERLYDAFNKLSSGTMPLLTKNIWNVLEDTYVEKRMAADFIGCGRNLRNLARLVFSSLDEDTIRNLDHLEDAVKGKVSAFSTKSSLVNALLNLVASYVLHAQRMRALPELEPSYRTMREYLDKCLPGMAEHLEPILEEAWEHNDSTEHNYEYAKKIVAAIYDKYRWEDDPDLTKSLNMTPEEAKQLAQSIAAARGSEGGSESGEESGSFESSSESGGESGSSESDSSESGSSESSGIESGNGNSSAAGASAGSSKCSSESMDALKKMQSKASTPTLSAPTIGSILKNNWTLSNNSDRHAASFNDANSKSIDAAMRIMSALEDMDDARQSQKMLGIDAADSIDVSANTKDAIENLQRNTSDDYATPSVSIEVVSQKNKYCGMLNQNDINEAGRITARLSAQLRALLQTFVMNPGGAFRTGRLDTRKLSRLAVNNANIFQKRIEQRGLDVEVILLVDMSGSMSGSKIRTTSLGLYALSHALYNIKGVRMGAYGFSGQNFIPIVELGSKPGANMNLEADDGTHCGEMSLMAMSKFSWREGTRRIFIIMTDGDSYNPSLFSKALSRMRKAGVEVIGIGIESNEIKQYVSANEYVCISNVKELPSKLFAVLRNKLLRRTSDR